MNIHCAISQEGKICLLIILDHIYAAIQSLPVYLLFNGQLAEFHAILDSFYWGSQYDKHLFRGDGWEWWVATKWLSKNLNGAKWPQLDLHMYKIPQNVAKTMPSITSQSCDDFQQGGQLSKQTRAISRTSVHS